MLYQDTDGAFYLAPAVPKSMIDIYSNVFGRLVICAGLNPAKISPKEAAVSVSNSPLVTVVLPVYNVRHYISRCFRSRQNQTYRNAGLVVATLSEQEQLASHCCGPTVVQCCRRAAACIRGPVATKIQGRTMRVLRRAGEPLSPRCQSWEDWHSKCSATRSGRQWTKQLTSPPTKVSAATRAQRSEVTGPGTVESAG